MKRGIPDASFHLLALLTILVAGCVEPESKPTQTATHQVSEQTATKQTTNESASSSNQPLVEQSTQSDAQKKTSAKSTKPASHYVSKVVTAPVATSETQPDIEAGVKEIVNTSNIDTYRYPFIKWKPKTIGGMPGAVAQLNTKHWQNDTSYSAGTLNYDLTLYKVTGPQHVRVQLLDVDGFKLVAFDVYQNQFEPVSDDLLQAKDSCSCWEANYKSATDYTVSVKE